MKVKEERRRQRWTTSSSAFETKESSALPLCSQKKLIRIQKKPKTK